MALWLAHVANGRSLKSALYFWKIKKTFGFNLEMFFLFSERMRNIVASIKTFHPGRGDLSLAQQWKTNVFANLATVAKLS